MVNKDDEYKELALFAEYISATSPIVEQYATDYRALAANPDNIKDGQFFGRALLRLIAVAQIEPPQSVMLAHIRLLQAWAHFISAFQAASDKDIPKSVGHLTFCCEMMKEIPPLLGPMNQKLKKTMAPVMREINKSTR